MLITQSRQKTSYVQLNEGLNWWKALTKKVWTLSPFNPKAVWTHERIVFCHDCIVNPWTWWCTLELNTRSIKLMRYVPEHGNCYVKYSQTWTELRYVLVYSQTPPKMDWTKIGVSQDQNEPSWDMCLSTQKLLREDSQARPSSYNWWDMCLST